MTSHFEGTGEQGLCENNLKDLALKAWRWGEIYVKYYTKLRNVIYGRRLRSFGVKLMRFQTLFFSGFETFAIKYSI